MDTKLIQTLLVSLSNDRVLDCASATKLVTELFKELKVTVARKDLETLMESCVNNNDEFGVAEFRTLVKRIIPPCAYILLRVN